MPTLKGQLFSSRPHQLDHGLLDFMGAGLGRLKGSAERPGLLARLDAIMKPARLDNVLPRYLREDPLPETSETIPADPLAETEAPVTDGDDAILEPDTAFDLQAAIEHTFAPERIDRMEPAETEQPRLDKAG